MSSSELWASVQRGRQAVGRGRRHARPIGRGLALRPGARDAGGHAGANGRRRLRRGVRPAGDRLAACSADRTIRFTIWQPRRAERPSRTMPIGCWASPGARTAARSPRPAAIRPPSVRRQDRRVADHLLGTRRHRLRGRLRRRWQNRLFRRRRSQAACLGSGRRQSDGDLRRHQGGVEGPLFALASSGQRLFTGSADRKLREHKLADLAATRTFAGPGDFVLSLAHHESTRRLAAGSFDGTVRMWNADDGQELLSFFAAPGYAPPGSPLGCVQVKPAIGSP